MLDNFYKVGEMRYYLDSQVSESFCNFKPLFKIWSNYNNLEFEFQLMIDSIGDGIEKKINKFS